jgi:hypothetical protein
MRQTNLQPVVVVIVIKVEGENYEIAELINKSGVFCFDNVWAYESNLCEG